MTESNSTEQPATEQPAVQERPTLTLQDLTLVVQILETMSARGAVKAEELSSVGQLYDRITAFLKVASGAPQPASDAKTDSAE